MAAGGGGGAASNPAGVAFRVLRNSQKASWVSKTHEAPEKAQKEIMSRDSVGGGRGAGGRKSPPDRTSCFGCAPELWAGGFRAHGVSLPAAPGSDVMRGKEVTGVPSRLRPPPPGVSSPGEVTPQSAFSMSAHGPVWLRVSPTRDAQWTPAGVQRERGRGTGR